MERGLRGIAAMTWEEAPKWANYRAMDTSGRWYWYEKRPKYWYYIWRRVSGKFAYSHTTENPALDPTKTLKERP